MSVTSGYQRTDELRDALHDADDSAFLVEPRVIRRLQRELHGYARLSGRIPHTEVLVAKQSDIKAFAHPDELGLTDFQQLPQLSILVAEPEEHEIGNKSFSEVLQVCWARLFHGRIDLRLQRDFISGGLTRATIQECIDDFGQVEFDEVHAVLVNEMRLVNVDSHVEAYCELVAQYHELSKFQPDLLSVWFPSLGNSANTRVLEQHFDANRIFEESRLAGVADPDLTPAWLQDEERLASERTEWGERFQRNPSERRYTRALRKRERANEKGNMVAAGVNAMLASENAISDAAQQQALQAAKQDTSNLVERLQASLKFSDADKNEWNESLWELLKNSTHGFWNADKRLLYDLQKVCLDNERTIYRIDLVKWLVSRGKRPIRRALTSIREVMMAKHLTSSAGRLVSVRLSGIEREKLTRLLQSAVHLAEAQMRDRMRSSIQETIRDVGLTPASIPEKVAFDKMVEESLDCIADRGYLTMGYLRDAISRNDLKLPDLSGPPDLIRGDHLLRSDDRLDVGLDGVYRRGEFYLRWLQVVSSLAFGTRTGRFLTQFLVIPFGGALILVESIQHFLLPKNDETSEETSQQGAVTEATQTETASTTHVAESENEQPDVELSDNAVAAKTQPIALSSDTQFSVTSNSIREDALALQPLDKTGKPVDNTESTHTQQSQSAPDDFPIDEVMAQLELPLILLVGLMLMGVIHVQMIQSAFFATLRITWRAIKRVLFDLPLSFVRLPLVQKIWRARWTVKLRRYLVNPFAIAWLGARIVPWAFSVTPQSWYIVGTIGTLLSLALNSRLGRDAEELTAEWVANTWYELRSRFVMALFDWVLDLFKWLLNMLERFIYAVDEWLRFHSSETWITVLAKAVLGVVWSFVSFLIRIYVNLLVEPTLHPVKHFPVVTVAHKLLLPVLIALETYMRATLSPYLGLIAGPFTWFTIFFLPGIFGFLVWELKENWRLYEANRVEHLKPVIIGSHGETGGRLLKPGFHSGTLPKLFAKLRRLERRDPSFQRFVSRRGIQEKLLHTEHEIRHFVERDLIRLLDYCPVWADSGLKCSRIQAASNSFQVILTIHDSNDPLILLFQEQSGWLVACIDSRGWLDSIDSERLHSFETALRGTYAKAGVDIVRNQLQRNLTSSHPYDIYSGGLVIWPDRQFDRHITADLNRRHQIKPYPIAMAASYGIQAVSREAVIFKATNVSWEHWKRTWKIPETNNTKTSLPLACLQSARSPLL